jgi:hypothetical protein
MRRRLSPVVAAVLTCCITCSHAATDIDPRLKTFAAQKRQQTEELAARLHLDVPTEAREFFKAAEAGDWIAVSNRFEAVLLRAGPSEVSMPLPSLRNALFVPIHETLGAYATFRDWDGTMLQKFADGVLGSMPAGSIFFGGTDAGRFIITAVRDVAKSPDVFVATPKFVMTPLRPPWIYNATQNAVADSLYMDYLRVVYGGQLWVPTTTDMQNAFQQYVAEVQSHASRGEQTGERISTNQDGNVQVSGVGGVMNINGIVTRRIFDHNKDKHPFFVEESYVIPWMYPYMEPHGLILKLNSEETDKLDPASVERDRAFWARLSKELLADPRFLHTGPERLTPRCVRPLADCTRSGGCQMKLRLRTSRQSNCAPPIRRQISGWRSCIWSSAELMMPSVCLFNYRSSIRLTTRSAWPSSNCVK